MARRDDRGRLWRSRWAAIGAAVAVTFGAGGLVAVNAAGGVDSTTVLTDPVRVLDSRDPVNVGLPGPFESQSPQKLKITGSIPTTTGTKTVVPNGATGVLLNVTAVAPEADGFISIRPGDATGLPTTSSLNVSIGGVLANAVLVALPTSGANAGQIDITWDAYGFLEPRTDILIDVVGYTNNSTLAALQTEIDAVEAANATQQTEIDAVEAANATQQTQIDAKANSADVYTKAEIDNSVANTTRQAGFVDTDGSESAFFAKVGNWSSSRIGLGVKQITIPAFDPGCDNIPSVQTNSLFGDAYSYVSDQIVVCNSGDATIGITTKDSSGALVDVAISFQTVAGAESPLAAGLSADTVCTFDESGMTCE